MSTSINKPAHTSPSILTEAATFIGIDFHKRYSVWHALDAAGNDLGKGRIEHHELRRAAAQTADRGRF